MDVDLKSINNQDTTIEFTSSAYSSSDDTFNLKLEGLTNTTNDTTLTGNDIETLNIDSVSSENSIKLGGTAVDSTSKLVITGDKDLSFVDSNFKVDTTTSENAMSKITTVDASDFTGNLNLNLENGGANNLDITGGIGNDKVSITEFTDKDVVDLGEGADRLDINLTTDVTSAASLKNIETISLLATADRTVNLEGATEIREP